MPHGQVPSAAREVDCSRFDCKRVENSKCANTDIGGGFVFISGGILSSLVLKFAAVAPENIRDARRTCIFNIETIEKKLQ